MCENAGVPRSEIEAVELALCHVTMVQLRMKFTHMQKLQNRKLYHFHNSAVELNALLIILKTGIVQPDDEW